MTAGTVYDTGAPTIEVRVYRNDQLLMSDDEDYFVASTTRLGCGTE